MKYIFFLAATLCLWSCSGSDGIPSGILGREKMGTVMWQLMQVDEFTADAYMRDTAHHLTAERIRRYKQVFDLNQTSKDEFEKSYKFYMSHPDITKVLFDTLNARANRQRDDASHPQPTTNTPAIPKPKPAPNTPNTKLEHIKLTPHPKN